MNSKYFLIVFCCLIAACSGEQKPEKPTETRLDILWNNTVEQLLKSDIWEPAYRYDASHVLMLPMEYAFSNSDEDFIKKQEQFHQAFLKSFEYRDTFYDGSILDITQYQYFVNRYLFKSLESGVWTDRHQMLFDENLQYFKGLWLSEPAWSWAHSSDFEGMKKRLDWKLITFDVNYSYYRAIIDDELFMFANAAELLKISKILGVSNFDYLVDVIEYAQITFEQESFYLFDNVWLFQPGVWSEHPNYTYAGNELLYEGLEKSMVSDITRDTSHGHRYPLVIKSLFEASNTQEQKLFFRDKLKGLRVLFEQRILLDSAHNEIGPRLTNYMDGHNGVYQYSPDKFGDKLGYAPSQLSGIITLGWYSFLGSEKLNNQLSNLEYPLSDELVSLYTGPNTSRKRHELLQWPEYFENGFAELYFLITQEHQIDF